MTTDNIKGYHYRPVIATNADTALSITPHAGGAGGIGSSYLLKGHHLFTLQLKYVYQEYRTRTLNNEAYTSPYDYSKLTNVKTSYDTYTSIQIPLTYGYSIVNKANFFSFTPYIGWVNQFNFLKDQYDNYFSFTEPPKKAYFGYALAGFRLKIKWFYLDCSYSRMLTKFREPYTAVRLQTVNLSVGYVYTFKQHENKNKAIK